jgi:hypothetical protein
MPRLNKRRGVDVFLGNLRRLTRTTERDRISACPAASLVPVRNFCRRQDREKRRFDHTLQDNY